MAKFYNFTCSVCGKTVEWAYQDKRCATCQGDYLEAERIAEEKKSAEYWAKQEARKAADRARIAKTEGGGFAPPDWEDAGFPEKGSRHQPDPRSIAHWSEKEGRWIIH